MEVNYRQELNGVDATDVEAVHTEASRWVSKARFARETDDPVASKKLDEANRILQNVEPNKIYSTDDRYTVIEQNEHVIDALHDVAVIISLLRTNENVHVPGAEDAVYDYESKLYAVEAAIVKMLRNFGVNPRGADR